MPSELGACDNPVVRCPVVVGRGEELAALTGIFSRAAGGRGACAVVTGEAGVGKTRLVTDAVGRARERGQAVLAGRSTPTDQFSPLRPLGEALLDGLRDRRPPDDPALAPYLPALGTLVPHWAAGPVFPAAPPPPVVLAEAMLRVLRWLSAGRGAILVLEDMHWADGETLAVLAYLADHVAAFPVAVVITARSDEPGSPGLGFVLIRDVLHLHLAPLGDSEVAAMAAACLGVDTAPLACRCWWKTWSVWRDTLGRCATPRSFPVGWPAWTPRPAAWWKRQPSSGPRWTPACSARSAALRRRPLRTR
jgi:AAA ATPase domain